MIVTFCGHAHFSKSEKIEQQILTFLEEKVGDQHADMYLGGYGGFDSFAYDCCKKYKETHPNIFLVLVTPYLTIEYQKTIWTAKRRGTIQSSIPKSKTSPNGMRLHIATNIWWKRLII